MIVDTSAVNNGLKTSWKGSMKGVESLSKQSLSLLLETPKDPGIRFLKIPGSGIWSNPAKAWLYVPCSMVLFTRCPVQPLFSLQFYARVEFPPSSINEMWGPATTPSSSSSLIQGGELLNYFEAELRNVCTTIDTGAFETSRDKRKTVISQSLFNSVSGALMIIDQST